MMRVNKNNFNCLTEQCSNHGYSTTVSSYKSNNPYTALQRLKVSYKPTIRTHILVLFCNTGDIVPGIIAVETIVELLIISVSILH